MKVWLRSVEEFSQVFTGQRENIIFMWLRAGALESVSILTP